MKKKCWKLYSLFLFLSKAKFYKGHGVHSPFAFDLILNVVNEKHKYYCFDKLEAFRNVLLKDKTRIFVTDFGTGKSRIRKISSIASRSLKKKRDVQLIFRLVNLAKPKSVVELGTSLGLTTAYLSKVDSKITCYSFEGCPELSRLAKTNLQQLDVKNAKVITENIDISLPEFIRTQESLDCVFFDANHTKEASLSYFSQCLAKVTSNSLFIFDDIYSSEEMFEAWQEIIANPRVRVSFNFYTLGFIYFNPDLKKQDYICLI